MLESRRRDAGRQPQAIERVRSLEEYLVLCPLTGSRAPDAARFDATGMRGAPGPGQPPGRDPLFPEPERRRPAPVYYATSRRVH